MHINKLKLTNFRNYMNLDIKLNNGYNVIYGNNAQGKTNILESIYVCTSGRSHRTSKNDELIKFGEKRFSIKLELSRLRSNTTIEFNYDREEKRQIKINEIPIKKLGNLMGQLNAVMFSPEDLLIIKEGPSERRRFIDVTLSQLKPSYFYDLQQYSKVLSQRNSLLKEISIKRSLMDTLEVWNNNLIDIGSRIIKTRYEFVAKLNKYVEEKHRKLTNNKENMEIKYSSFLHLTYVDTLSEIKEKFEKTLEKSLNKEILKGTTLIGPQRDDYDIILNGMNTKLYGSQGQQRTAILSLKLSEIELMKEDTGEYPVLLLDDVMSELDDERQKFLLEYIDEIQTFITCTDKDFLNKNIKSNAVFINIKGGEAVFE